MTERIRGVNLSGWFIPEPWVTPSLFAATGASNDSELQSALGATTYNERLRRHLETFISEDDFRRITAIGLNAVRLPVPWYAFGSQGESEVYIPLVDYIDRAFEWAEKYHMGVLLDLATVPGGQGDSNATPSTPESTAAWHSSTNGRHIALNVLERLAARYGMREGLLGRAGTLLLGTALFPVLGHFFSGSGPMPGRGWSDSQARRPRRRHAGCARRWRTP